MGIKIPSYTEIELTAGGGVQNISPSDSGNFYLITGTSTLIADWTIQYDASYSISEQEGMEAVFKWRANIDLDGNSITILGTTLTDEMVSKQGTFTFEYTGATWIMKWKPDHEETDFITTQLKTDTTNGTSITRSADGARLTNDENTPDERDIYAYLSSSKGWKSFGALLDEFDSGWKNIPTYNSSTGLWQPTSNHPSTPQFRVVGRVVYFRGRLVIPLDDGAGNAYTDFEDTVYSGYQRKTVNVADSGINGDFSSADYPIKFPQMFPTNVLNPDVNTNMFPADAFRLVTHNGLSTGYVLRLGVAATLGMRADTGGLAVYGLYDRENAQSLGISGENRLPNDKWRSIATIVTAGDDEYDLSTTDSWQIDPSTVATTGRTYPLTFDGTDARDFGGVQVHLKGFSYIIKPSSTLEQIKAAWEVI